jgi:cation diffusion facilitator family transporter
MQDPSKMPQLDDETKQIQQVALYGFLVNLGLAIMKAALAVFSGSLAVTASAIDSATDSIASLILFGGVKLSIRRSATFPLGLYKIENVISVIVALFIFLAGYEIGCEVLVPAEQLPRISPAVIILLAAGTVLIFIFGRYAIAVGKRTGSPTLMAEGRHRQVDVLSSIVVLGSVIMSYANLRIDVFGITIDQIAAGLVLVFIAHAGWELLSGGMRVLLDASIDFDTLEQIRKIIEAEPLVVSVRSLVGRSAGRFRFVQADAIMRTEDLKKAHDVSENIESVIRREVQNVIRVTIRVEPQARDYLRLAIPVEEPDGRVSQHFGEAPYFALILIRRSDLKIEEREFIRNPHTKVEKAKGIQVAEWLVNQKVDRVILREEIAHKGPGYVLSNAGVKIRVVPMSELDEAIDAVLSELR